MSKKDDHVSNAVDSMLVSSALKQDTSSNLGITQEYNKENRDKLWDSAKGKEEFKKEAFGDHKTMVDPITGKVLHKSQVAAQNKYHMKNGEGENISSAWAEHSVETDHIVPIKTAHKFAKHNPFLTDDDLKEVVNDKTNYRNTSKSLNASKGEKSDLEVIADPKNDISAKGKVGMAKENIRAATAMHAHFAEKTAKNIGNEFVTGAENSLIDSVFPLTVDAVNNMICVAKGDKSFAEAGKDFAKDVVGVAVRGGTNKVLGNIIGQNELAQITKVSMIVKDSAVKYINGEISEKEFVEEIGVKGTEMVASMIGGNVGREIGFLVGATIGSIVAPGAGTFAGAVVGELVGEMLGAIITSIACSAIATSREVLKHIDDYKIKESQIKRLTTNALKEMEHQRILLKNMIDNENVAWNETIDESFEMMVSAVANSTNIEESFDGITKGLDKIMSLFNSSAKFHTVEEFDAQLDQPLVI